MNEADELRWMIRRLETDLDRVQDRIRSLESENAELRGGALEMRDDIDRAWRAIRALESRLDEQIGPQE